MRDRRIAQLFEVKRLLVSERAGGPQSAAAVFAYSAFRIFSTVRLDRLFCARPQRFYSVYEIITLILPVSWLFYYAKRNLFFHLFDARRE